jgi:hypothetical protein
VSPEQGDRLGKIGSAGQHLLEIINAILDLSKIEAGKFTLEEADLDISALVNNVAALFQERAEDKGLCLTTDIGKPTTARPASTAAQASASASASPSTRSWPS